MKILLLNDDVPPQGRSSVALIVEGLSHALQKRGHSVTVFTAPACSADRASEKSLKDVLKDLRPDVIHAHNIQNKLGYDVLTTARNHTDRVFLTLHDVSSFSYGRMNTTRYLNNGDARWRIVDHWLRAGLRYRPWRNARIRSVLRKYVKQVFTVSEALQRAAAQNGIRETVVMYNGIDVDAWQSTPEAVDRFVREHDLKNRKTILFGGRLSMDKGVVPLLSALEELRKTVPNVLLLVVGDPVRWEKLIKEAGCGDLRDHCRILGWLGHDAMKTACGAADIVTTPSLCLDCFPTLNLEAMAARKPVVGTIFGGTPEAVEHGVTGYVCDPRKTEEYISSLLRLLQNDALRLAMGQKGYERVREKFALSRQVDALLEYYGKI